MEYIRSKDIFLLIRDTLKLYDPRPMQHGSRVAYIVAKMMQCKGCYEGYELADAVMLVTLHDVVAYTTDNLDHLLTYENKDFMPHATSGYLFFNSMSPFGTDSKVILYHHTEYAKMKGLNFDHKELAAYLYIAEKFDLYSTMLDTEFDYHMLDKYAGTRYSAEGLKLLTQAIEQQHILEKLKSGEYIEELKEINSYMIFIYDFQQRG